VTDATVGRDPGLQGERTALSWTRTALAIAVNALLALRTGWAAGEPALAVLGAILLLAAGAAVLYGNRRGRALAGHTAAVPTAPPAAAMGLATLATLLACVVGVASVLMTR
jgi:hypothetical protein